MQGMTMSDHHSLALTVRTPDPENSIGPTDTSASPPLKKDVKFGLIFASMCICLFLSALELLSVSTALPTIARELQSSQFIWVGSAYALSSTAFLPASGGLAQTFGRRPAILMAIGLFALGSAICGAARSMSMLIAGRTVQGLGGGGIQSLTSIILADIVSLQERGTYAGLFGLTWCLAASIGPVVGGSLAAQGKWRWLFYLNIPIALVGCLSVILFLDLPTPPGNYREKFGRVDWTGNLLVIASTVAYTIGLTWGGTTAPWGSAIVLVPLVLGLLGVIVFVAYETTIATHPLVPSTLMTNVTSVSGYIQAFCIALNTSAVVYFLPVYFQACKGVSPVLSGIYTLCLCAFAPTAILSGLSVKATGRYRPQMWAAWGTVLIAMGLLSYPTADGIGAGTKALLGYSVLLGLGTGVLYATTMYPIQAPLSATHNAPALAWMWFLRSVASVWGITLGSAVLQNELQKTLPESSSSSSSSSFFVHASTTSTLHDLFAQMPDVSALAPSVRSEVEGAFARSGVVVWRVLTAVCAVGGVASLFMSGLALSHTLDATWAVQHADKRGVEHVDVVSR